MWIKKGILNTLELGLTRAFDALIIFALIKILPKPTWSKLIVAQAICLPLLFFFISPSGALYRHFVAWKEEGTKSLLARLKSLRLYGMALGGLAVVFSFGLAHFYPKATADSDFVVDFYAYLWAFTLYTGMHWSGADREFLRLELQLKTLNLLTLMQKVLLFVGSLACGLVFPERVDYLCYWAVFSWVFSSLVTTSITRKTITVHALAMPEMKTVTPTHGETLVHCFKGFSIWFHLNGIILSWIQGLHLNVLAWMRYPESIMGIFGVAVKLANLTTVLPSALGNWFQVYLGREKRSEDETSALFKRSFQLFAVSIFQGAVIYLLAPYLLQILGSRQDALNAWTEKEYEVCLNWTAGLVITLMILNGSWLFYFWVNQRGNVKRLLFQVFIPWLLIAGFIYCLSAKISGPDAVAFAGIPITLAYLVLLLVQVRREA